MPILPGTNSCDGSNEADTIFDKLVDNGDFDFPEIDLNGPNFAIPPSANNPLYDDVDKVSIDELTNRQIGGTGVFDALMDAMSVHLKDQYEKDRITGREYADVYTAAIQGAMGQAVSFLMGKDNAYWQAIMTQAQARTAEIEAVRSRILLENTKLEYFTKKATAKTAAAEYAVKKMQLALMDQDFCQKLLEKTALTLDVEEKRFRNDEMLPLQRDQLSEAIAQVRAVITGIGWDNQLKKSEVEDMQPRRIEMLDSQIQTASIEREMARFNMDEVLPWQSLLTREQAEAARAQTTGNRSDGSPISGVIGWDNRTKQFNLEDILPRQRELLQNQVDGAELDNNTKTYTLSDMLPAQHQMIMEQVEGARAQTMDTRIDGTPVVGLVGKQKDLYTQQIESYQRDAEVKAAKMFIDTWVTQKTIDEGLIAPTVLQNASIETVMSRIKTNNGLNA